MLCEHGGRSVRIRALPIGIPYEHFESLARNAPPNSISTENIKIILGVDRLDYTKGRNKIIFVFFSIKSIYSFIMLLEYFPAITFSALVSCYQLNANGLSLL